MHPSRPKKPNNQRVSDYWSVMVIRPTSNSFKTAGVEYALTYFDNPGIVMPAAVTSWVAQKQMPEFLNKMHLATIEYAEMRRNREQYEQKTVSESILSIVCQIRAQSLNALMHLNVVQLFSDEKKLCRSRSGLRVSTRAGTTFSLLQIWQRCRR